MRKFKCLIVDDEPPAIKILKNYIDSLDYLEITGTCNNAFQTIDFLNKEKVDMLFLDIDMPKLLVTKMLKTNNQPPKVIFTTAHKDYAIEALELDAIDYLLKPVSFERFLKTVNKFCQINNVETDQYVNAPGFLYFRAGRKMVKVFLKDITYIESLKDYIVIHRKNDDKLKVKCTIGSVETILPQNLFQCIHRSYIVSIKKVTAFTNNDVELGKTELPFGKSYPGIFKKLIGNSSPFPNDDQ